METYTCCLLKSFPLYVSVATTVCVVTTVSDFVNLNMSLMQGVNLSDSGCLQSQLGKPGFGVQGVTPRRLKDEHSVQFI